MDAKDLENISDNVLLARIQNGDDDALVALIEKYERLLKTIIYYEIGNPEEKADIYQETVLAIVRRIRRQAEGIRSVKQWVKQIARSKCKAFLVDAKKRGIVRDWAEDYYALRTDQQEQKSENVDQILDVVEEMGSIYVEVVELWADGLTEAESAEVLNISPNTVKSRRNKIRKVARERFGVSVSK